MENNKELSKRNLFRLGYKRRKHLEVFRAFSLDSGALPPSSRNGKIKEKDWIRRSDGNFLQLGLASQTDIEDWSLRYVQIPSPRPVGFQEFDANKQSWVGKGRQVRSGSGKTESRSQILSPKLQDSDAKQIVRDLTWREIGEVRIQDTINYRSFRPEMDGLFCERIFGPVQDFTCACGIKHRGGFPPVLRSAFRKFQEEVFHQNQSPLSVSGKVAGAELQLEDKKIKMDRALLESQDGISVVRTPRTHSPFQRKFAFGLARYPGGSGLSIENLSAGGLRKRKKGLSLVDTTSDFEIDSESFSKNHQVSPDFESSSGPRGRGQSEILLCSVCLVEFTKSRIRRHRIGLIRLQCKVMHIWFQSSRPAVFSLFTGLAPKYLRKIAYYKGYTVSSRSFWNPCLSPGGDFYDTEWEFIHSWLGRNPSPVSFGQFPSQSKSESKNRSFHSLNLLRFLGAESYSRKDKAQIPSVSRDWAKASGYTRDKSKPSQDIAGPRWKNPRSISPSLKYLPNWLIGTGAGALFDLCDSRNWLDIQVYLKAFLFSRHMPGLPIPYTSRIGSRSSVSVENLAFSNLNSEGLTLARSANPRRKTQIRRAKAKALQTRGDFGKTRQSPRKIPAPSYLRLFKALELILTKMPRRKKSIQTQRENSMSLDRIFEERNSISSQNPSRGNDFHLLDSFILDRVPVLPPELRPIVEVHPGQLASSDVNDLYRRLISRNTRLQYYSETRLPVEFLVRSERHLVQLACDALFENGKTTHLRHQSGSSRSSGGNQMTSGGPLYRSLTDRIGGKYGRFRQNLLGKRVDYSGRSVICVGPHLKLHECGLPSLIAQELFQPFLIRHILEFQLSRTIRGAKKILQLNFALSQSLLRQIMESHPILLNRAPTLHRLGIQAFQPKLHNGKAIELHPAVCSAFNADFDGDQMAVHVPLSPRARTEARLLMLARTNWLSPATGSPSIVPSQDIVLGFYYLTSELRDLGQKFTRDKGDFNLGAFPSLPSKISFSSKEKINQLERKDRIENSDVSFLKKKKSLCLSDYCHKMSEVQSALELGQIQLQKPIWVQLENSSTAQGIDFEFGSFSAQALTQIDPDFDCRHIIGSQTRDISQIRTSNQISQSRRSLSSEFQKEDGLKFKKRIHSSAPPLSLEIQKIDSLFSLCGFPIPLPFSLVPPQFQSSLLRFEIRDQRNYEKGEKRDFRPNMVGSNIFEPLHLRIFGFGNLNITYPEFQIHRRLQDRDGDDEKKKNSLVKRIIIRTTPGRILCTRILQKYL